MILKYNSKDFTKNKSLRSYIRAVERQFRTSFEYREWLDNQHRNRILICPFSEITNQDGKKLIELHHHPLTLYVLGEYVLSSLVELYKLKYPEVSTMGGWDVMNYIPTFMTTKILADIHLKDLVPYVPLTSTYHKLYHDGVTDEGETLQLKTEWIVNYDKIDDLDDYLKRIANGEIEVLANGETN